MKISKTLRKRVPLTVAITAAAALILLPLLYRLGTLIGLSPAEQAVAGAPIGWTGILENPLYLPLLLLRSAAFFLTDTPGAFITRLPNILIGAIAVVAFTLVVRAWHGTRVGLLAGALFLTTSWTLHVSRYASYDVLYFLLVPLLLALQAGLLKWAKNRLVVLLAAFTYSSLLLVPGAIWFVLLSLYWQRRVIGVIGTLHQGVWFRLAAAGTVLSPLALLINGMATGSTNPFTWLGLPTGVPQLTAVGRDLLEVPVHLFIAAPAVPELWLGRLPILSAFAIVAAILGIYYYVFRNFKAGRTRMLLSYAFIGWLLVGIAGPVALSVLVPLLFIAVAAGIALLLRDWFGTFPYNPFARAVGICLILIVTTITVSYNLQRYFFAWPNNTATRQAFTP